MQQLQKLIDRLRSGNASVDEIRSLLHASSIVVRANALEALVPHAKSDHSLLTDLTTAISDPKNQARLMGTITLAHLAIASLFRVGSEKATEIANELIDTWPETDRSDLEWYLKSEGLLPMRK
jgi:hypothetical protein